MTSAESLSREFAARLGGVHRDAPGGLLGIEQEFSVLERGGSRVDFRTLLHALPLVGVRLDPTDPRAVRTPSGVVVTADGPEAEAATPPITVREGCARDAEDWARVARAEIAGALGGSHHLVGYSTHLSVSVDDSRNPRVGALFTRTFAAGLMLLMDRATSPGLIVRPRPGRTELCGEFVDGAWLRAASVYAVGSVLACRDAIRGADGFSSLPPQLRLTLRTPSARPGWYVDRGAFGPDLIAGGRGTRLRRCDGRRTYAQDHLEASWSSARAALGDRVGADDLAAVDAVVGRAGSLPSEVAPAAVDAGEPGPRPTPSALGSVGQARLRPGFVVDAHAATWKWTVFAARSRTSARTLFASVPRAHHERFFALLDGGALDDLLDAALALPATGRVVAMTGTEPALGDVAPAEDVVGERELDRTLASTVSGARARGDKDRAVIVPFSTGIGEPLLETRRGCLPGTRWLVVGGVVVALVIAGLVVALRGGGGETSGTSEPSPQPSSEPSSEPAPAGAASTGLDVCGTGTGGLTITWTAATDECRNPDGSFLFPQTLRPYRTVTVATGGAPLEFSVGTSCKIHDASATELDDAEDPTNGFRGLSLLGVPVAGLPPGAVVEVVLVAPDGTTVRTGRATADAAGYAEVRVPINTPQVHTIRSVRIYPTGDLTGTAIDVAPTEITPDGRIDGTFPGNRCDRSETIAEVGTDTTASVALDEDEVRTIVIDSAALWPPLLALVGPGSTIDQTPALHADGSEGYVEIGGFATGFDLWPGTARGRDPAGAVPAFVDSYGGALVYPSTGDTASYWEQALGCGPHPLASVVCTPAKADLRDLGYLKVGAVFDRPVPVQPSGTATYTFTVGKATVELMARNGTWSLRGPDDARALLRNNVVFVLVPTDAAGTADYRVSTVVGSRRDVQPVASEPPLPITNVVRAAAPPGDHETPEQFASALGRALSSGDAAFLRSRLHPAVVERYGEAQCTASTAAAGPPTTIVATGVEAPTVYAWQTDGLTREVPNVNSVAATRDGAAVTLHFALVDGTWRWFTDCGTSQVGAR